jgi:CheY-like chemotaxis protein
LTGKEKSTFVVLLADDDEDDCLLVELALRDTGIAHILKIVGDGRELMDYLHNDGNFSDPEKYPRPSLILLDLNMPLVDGRKALGIIKSDPWLREIPVLILTTSREKHDIDLTEKAGAASFVAKPDSYDALTEMLEKFCTAVLDNPDIPFRVVGC